MIIQGLTDGLLAVEEVVAAFLRVSLFAALLVGIRIGIPCAEARTLCCSIRPY